MPGTVGKGQAVSVGIIADQLALTFMLSINKPTGHNVMKCPARHPRSYLSAVLKLYNLAPI